MKIENWTLEIGRGKGAQNTNISPAAVHHGLVIHSEAKNCRPTAVHIASLPEVHTASIPAVLTASLPAVIEPR